MYLVAAVGVTTRSGLCLLVPLEFAELADFFICEPPYMHLRECGGATVAFRLPPQLDRILELEQRGR